MYSTGNGWLLLGMLLHWLLTLSVDGNVSLGQLWTELVGLRHWTIHWAYLPILSHGRFLWKHYLRLSTSIPTDHRSRNQPFLGSVTNGEISEAGTTHTTDSAMAVHLHTIPTSGKIRKWRYQPICLREAKLFWPPPFQGLQLTNSLIESAETVWISNSLTESGRVRVVPNDGWSLVAGQKPDEPSINFEQVDYWLLLLLEYTHLLTSLGLLATVIMDADTIVYPTVRSLRQIRIVDRNLRNTNELQMYLPRKTLDKELTANQLMSMVEQIITHIGVTITTGDKHKLQVALEHTVRENVVQASISGGFSTASILHLKVRIEPVGVSTNGVTPHTIPFALRIPVHINKVVNAIGADGNTGTTGQSTAQTIVSSFKSMAVAAKKDGTNKKGDKKRTESERQADEKRKKQAKQNFLARQGIVETGRKEFTVTVIAGPSVQYGTDSRDPLDSLLTSTMQAPKHYVAKLVGFNQEMLQALGDVLNIAQKAFEGLLSTLLEDEPELSEDICGRLYYQFHEVRHGNEKLENIYVVYLAYNEDEQETSRRVTFLENILSAHYDGDQFVYKKGLKFLIRRYRSHSKEKTSTEIIRARRTVANATIQPPFVLVIDSLSTTPQFAMERIVALFKESTAMNPRAINAIVFLEHIGPITDNTGIYLSFTQHLMASKIHRLFLQHPRAMKEIFHALYGVKHFFGAKGTFSREALTDEYPAFFTAVGDTIPRPLLNQKVNKFDIISFQTPALGLAPRTSTSYSDIITGQHNQTQEPSDSDDDLDNSNSSKRMKTSGQEEKLMDITAGLDIKFDDTQKTLTQKQSQQSVIGKRKQASDSDVGKTGANKETQMECEETQEPGPTSDDTTPPLLAPYLQHNPIWKKRKNKDFHHQGGKITIQAKEQTRFLFEKLCPVEPIKTIDNDCGVWCMSKMLRLIEPVDLTPAWSHEGITQEDLIFIMKQKEMLNNLNATQISELKSKFRKMAISLTMETGFFGETMTLTITDALTGDLIIDFLNLNFGLLQLDNGTMELIALKEGLTMANCTDPDYYHQGYIVLFIENHMRLIYFDPYRKTLEAIFQTISTSEGTKPFPIYDDYNTRVRDMHYGAETGINFENTDPSDTFDVSETSLHNSELNSNNTGTINISSMATDTDSDNNIGATDANNSLQVNEEDAELFPIFRQRQSSSTENVSGTRQPNGFTTGQFQSRIKERAVDGKHLPTIWANPATYFRRMNIGEQSIQGPSGVKSPHSGRGRRSKRLRRQVHHLSANQELDILILEYYHKHYGGRSDLFVEDITKIGSGLFTTGALHPTDMIPIVGRIQLTCSANQLRRQGGINILRDGRGYLVESLQYDVGYGEIAKEKSSKAHNFARCIKLIPKTDPRVNMKLDHTPHGSLILTPTRLILGHPQRPVELFLGHDEIVEPVQDNQSRSVSSTTQQLAPIFRPTGKRRDPQVQRMEQSVLPREEQPGTLEDLDDTEPSPNTPCFGSITSVSDCLKACLNMKGNGTSVPLLTEVVKFFREQKIDVLALIDTGIVSRDIARTVYKKFFGSAHIYIIPAKAPRLSTARKQKAVGGMIIIINEKRTKIERHFKDPSELGIFHTVRLKVRDNMVDIMFIYWPTTNREQIAEESLGYHDGLACKLLDYLHQQNINISPDEWIEQQIAKRCPTLDQQDHRYFFLMGDMNRTYNIQDMDKEGTLAHLVTSLGLTTSLKHLLDSKGLGCNSFFRGEHESEIDHIFTNAPMDLISHGGRGLKSRWCGLNYTDHVMIWFGTSLSNVMPMPEITPETSLILGALAKIENDSDHTRTLVQQALSDWWDQQAISKPEGRQQFFTSSSIETLGKVSEQLSRQMSTVVIDALSKPTRRHRSNGLRTSSLWSPKISSIMAHYGSIEEIISILEKPKELGSQIRSCRREIDYWHNKIIKRRRATNAYDYKPEDEGCTSVADWISFLDQASTISDFAERQRERRNLLLLARNDKKTLGSKIHGRNRKEFANTMSGHLSKREAVLIDKHLKRAFASLTETQKAAYNFAELSDSDGNVTTDQYEIHDQVSKFFESIFKNPEDALPTKLQLEQNNLQSMPLWQRMLEDDEVFQDIFSQSNIPAEIIKIISSAFCTTDANREKRNRAKEHVLKALEEPFTFEEFHRMIKRARGSSAGGITGLSYGILKLAPEPLLEHLFEICARMWEQRYIPPYWRVKYLHLLVKDLSKSGLNNLRPIGLIEVLRKIWSNLVIHRIRCAMYESQFFSPAQYGFISRKGTTDELIQLTNVLEEASESNKHIEMTTWDITKAFDSVGRNIQFITWLRMGVPIDVAKWFVDLDNGGYFIVRSPYALHHMRTLNHPTAPAEVVDLARQLGFQAERGYTQGDVLSTTGWVGFFDILLTALEQLTDIGKFFYRTEGVELQAQDSMAYADDLVTVSANREQTDAYAEIICGFMALFGLKLAPTKIRSSTTISPPGVLTYYDWEWRAYQRPFGNSDTPITILGVIMSASGSWEAQYEYLLLHCQRITQTVGHKLASLSLKTKLLLCSTLAQILYRTQVIALLPSQLDQLNKVLFKVIRDFKDIGLTFPTQALITKHLGGIFTDVHSATIKRKWSLQGRMLAIGGAQSKAMQSLLGRLHRTGFYDHSPSGQSAFVSTGLGGALPRWGDDLPRSLREGIGLKYFGYQQDDEDPLLSSMTPAPSVECAEVLEELSIYYRSELTPDGSTIPDWLHPRNMPEFRQGLRHLLESNLIQDPVGEPRAEPSCTIAPDQLYTFIGADYEEIFFEVSGILPSGLIAGRRWKRVSRQSKKLVPCQEHDSQGRAYPERWDPQVIPLATSRRAIAYSPCNHDREMRLLGTHSQLRGQIPPAMESQTPPWCTRIIHENAITLGITSMIVSDASYIRHTETMHSLFRTEVAPPNHAEGAFVLFKPGCIRPTLGIIIKGMADLGNYNAFVGELLTGLGAEQFRACLPGSIELRLDCASVISATGQRLPPSSDYYVNLQEDYGTVLSQFSRLRRNTNHPPIKWTRGHPDRDVLRKNGTTDHAIPRHEWGQAEYGIYIADHLADLTDRARTTLMFEGLLPERIVEVSIQDILAAIPTRGQWLRCPVATPNIPLLTPQREIADDKIFIDYCRRRDQLSNRPARWAIIQPGMLRPSLKILGALGWASKWASYIRIILDKLPHNRNLMKGRLGPILPCQVCNRGEDSLEHLIRCEGNCIRTSREHFHGLLIMDIRSYCQRHGFSDTTRKVSIEYAKALVSTSLSEQDTIGGWLGIPNPRFLYFYHSDCDISQKVGKQFRQVLSRIIAESIKWLQIAWRLRCRAAHAGSSQEDSQSTRSNTTTRLTSFHRMARGQHTHRTPGSERSSQTSLLPHLVDDLHLTPIEFGLDNDDGEIEEDRIEENNISGLSNSPEDIDMMGVTADATPPPSILPTYIDNTGRPQRYRITNLRGRLIEGEPLLYDLSDEVAFAEGRTWADLGNHEYYPLYNDIGLLLVSPVEIWIGPSRIPGAGLGLFIFTSYMTLHSGTGIGKYWGPSTRNGGIPLEYAPEDSPIPEGTRDDGDYLLRHGSFLVDADEDCSMGYANEGWHDANCFFQHTANNDPDLLLVLKKKLLPNRVYELTVNYGREYWFSGPNPRIFRLGAAARQLCELYYGG